jgi:hypothetical protein
MKAALGFLFAVFFFAAGFFFFAAMVPPKSGYLPSTRHTTFFSQTDDLSSGLPLQTRRKAERWTGTSRPP